MTSYMDNVRDRVGLFGLGPWFTKKKIVFLYFPVLLLAVFGIFGQLMFEDVDSREMVVVQYPITGTLKCYVEPGLKMQLFGSTQSYPRLDKYDFEAPIRFNEGGKAIVFGEVQSEMPLDCDNIIRLHRRYGSWNAIKGQIVQVTTDRAIYMTGPLLSSAEAYATKRPNMIAWAEDQMRLGVYSTQTQDELYLDPLTGEERTITVATILTDDSGNPLRHQESPMEEFAIRIRNFAVKEIDYEERIDAQIQVQQENRMAVQTAIAQARKAEQDAITAEEQGKAAAASARWEIEVEKAKAVTAAGQRLEVAQLERQTADETRRKEILLGQGEAERRRLNLQADGALKMKLDTWLKAQEVWAAAIQGHGGSWVPNVVLGSNGGTQTGGLMGVNELLTLFMANAAKDLSLDMTVPRGTDGR
jgi:hypothetical protein